MNDSDGELRRLLRSLDPVASDAPPAKGSDRYRSIQETAMHTDNPTTPEPHARADLAITGAERQPPRRRWRLGLAAAAVIVVVGAVLGAVVVRTDSPTAEVAVSDAAAAMTSITSLEGELTRTTPESTGTTRLRVDGDAFSATSQGTYADGHVEESTTTVIDGFLYETIDNTTTRTPRQAEDGLAPFGPSSDAVLTAATNGSVVTEVGTEQVGDVEAVRYDIVLGSDAVAALAALTPNQLAWFELEYPEQVDSMSVWIADGLVRQIETEQRDQTIRTRFFNLNGDVRIEAPPGPYVEPGS